MLTNLLLGILNFVWYDGFEVLWPKSIGGFSLNTFTDAFNSLMAIILPGLRIANGFVPIDVFFGCIGLFIGIVVLFFMIRFFRWIWGLLPFVG